jgi:hypothetical protein
MTTFIPDMPDWFRWAGFSVGAALFLVGAGAAAYHLCRGRKLHWDTPVIAPSRKVKSWVDKAKELPPLPEPGTILDVMAKQGAIERWPDLQNPDLDNDQQDKTRQRGELIAKGRDIAHRYEQEGLAEPFATFIAGERAYMDIVPHLGSEYLAGYYRRNEKADTPESREYSFGMFKRELARLEKEWKL